VIHQQLEKLEANSFKSNNIQQTDKPKRLLLGKTKSSHWYQEHIS